MGRRCSKLPPYPVPFLQFFLQLMEVEEVQQKMSLALGEQQLPRQEQKSQKVESIYQILKIRACSSEE